MQGIKVKSTYIPTENLNFNDWITYIWSLNR
jgi:hypothetical protein